MNLSTVEREEVATELKRFASDLNLTDDQKEKLHVALTEAREKIAEYMQQNPNTTKADVISKIVANRDAIRQRVVASLVPSNLRSGTPKKPRPRTSWARRSQPKDSLRTEVSTLGWSTIDSAGHQSFVCRFGW